MLESRPIVQKSLYGTGAFFFVFAAAMAGTAFMISGGIGGGEHRRADPPAYYMAGSWAEVPEQTVQHAARVVQASLPATAEAAAPQPDTQNALPEFPSADDPSLSGEQEKTADPAPAQTPAPTPVQPS